MKLKLYHYWRSSAAWRVRWAFQIKKVECEFIPIDLLKGEQKSPEHLARNPMGAVPVLEFPANAGLPARFLTESLAIIEWTEETIPSPALLPKDPYLKAQARSLALEIAAGTHPHQNMKILKFHSADPAEQDRWAAHWITEGLRTYDKLVAPFAKTFSMGERVSLPDLFLIPQCYNALRRKVDLEQFPHVARIYKNALATPECQASAPERFAPTQT